MFIYVVKLFTMVSFIFIFILFQSMVWGQIKDVEISIESRNLKNNQKQYLEKLENDIEFYLLSNNFIETNNDDLSFSIDINLIIESISNNIISAHVIFSNRLDQILFSDGIDFEYEFGQSLIYTTSYSSLTSFLNYNIFIMIGGELDKIHYKGGESYYIRSEDIAYQGSISDYPRRWNKRLKQCRELKNNLYLRNLKHVYHDLNKYLDQNNQDFDENTITALLEELYDELLNINDYYGYHKNTMLFLNQHLLKLIELYYEYDMIHVIKFLKEYDENNTELYNEYID